MKIKLLFLALFLSSIVSAQIKVGKIILDYEVEYEEETLKLNGAGIRSNFLLGDLYVGALYLKEKNSDPIDIAFADEVMAIHLHITSRIISKETIVNAIRDGFDKATNGNTEPYKEGIEQIKKYFSEEIEKGDTIDFVYLKDKGMVCYHNKKELGVIKGRDFKFVHFKIWLGEKPASKSLKRAMLGKI